MVLKFVLRLRMMCLHVREECRSDQMTSEGRHGLKEGWGVAAPLPPPVAHEVVQDL